MLRHLGQLDEPEEITEVKLCNQQATMQRLVHSYLVCLDNNSDQREKISQLVKEAQSAAEDLVKKDDVQKELTEKLTAERKTTEQLREKMKSLEEQLQGNQRYRCQLDFRKISGSTILRKWLPQRI